MAAVEGREAGVQNKSVNYADNNRALLEST